MPIYDVNVNNDNNYTNFAYSENKSNKITSAIIVNKCYNLAIKNGVCVLLRLKKVELCMCCMHMHGIRPINCTEHVMVLAHARQVDLAPHPHTI